MDFLGGVVSLVFTSVTATVVFIDSPKVVIKDDLFIPALPLDAQLHHLV